MGVAAHCSIELGRPVELTEVLDDGRPPATPTADRRPLTACASLASAVN